MNKLESTKTSPIQALVNTAGNLVKESAFTLACKAVLDTTYSYVETKVPSSLQESFWMSIVAAPLFEEILFRGLIQTGIRIGQEVRMIKKELSAADLKAQKVFRVHVTAFMFGAVHLLNPHKTVFSALNQFTLAYVCGVQFGYIREKYQTLALTILAHGFHNTIVCLSIIGKLTNNQATAILLTNQVILFILSRDESPLVYCQKVALKVKYVVEIVYSGAGSSNLINSFQRG